MFSLVVLTNADTAAGFRLAGSRAVVADTIEVAREKLAGLLNDDRAGIIAVDNRFAAAVDDALQAKIDRLFRPVVVVLPEEAVGEASGKEAGLEHLIKRAVGFDIELG